MADTVHRIDPLAFARRHGGRLWQWWRRQDSVFAAGLALLLILTFLVARAALFPAGRDHGEQLGKWRPLVSRERLMRTVTVDYDPAAGRLQLNGKLDGLDTRRERRFVASHIRKFNRTVNGRTFKRETTIEGRDDCLFAVDLRRSNGDLVAVLKLRDLSAHNRYPIGRRARKDLGRIHMRPLAVTEPYLSDGYLGLFLVPGVDDTLSKRIDLGQSGFFSAARFTLVDSEGFPRAVLRAGPDGRNVVVEPSDDYSVFLDNNPPIGQGQVVVEQGGLVEIGGRFFEAHVDDSGLLAETKRKDTRVERVYPMGSLFHIVGPVALDGRHQSLGIEYMFQEYLMGDETRDIPPGELWLTLHRRLQADLVEGAQFLADKRNSRAGVASALIMDAHTGAVLAMAGEPHNYDPEDRTKIVDILQTGDEFRYNHGGFKRHVIGSVTKAFFAFMAMQVWGEEATDIVLDMRGGNTKTLYGHDLYGNAARSFKLSSGRIDFQHYLAKSDNPYQHAMSMLLLAGVEDLDRDMDPYWGARDQRGRFLLKPFDRAADRYLTAGTLGQGRRNRITIDENNRFGQLVRTLFDIETGSDTRAVNDRDISIYGESLLDLAANLILSRNPLVDAPRDILKTRSVICAPETPRMELSEVRNTKDASNVLFGAHRNTWTDVKLCESFSRIMTGKRVRARLIHQYRDTLAGDGSAIVDLEAAARDQPEPWDIPRPESLPQLRRMLAAVVGPRGTADELAPLVKNMRQIAPGFALYGKTGTIDDPVRKDDPDSKLFLGTFGIAEDHHFTGPAYTFVIYLKNAEDETALWRYLNQAIPRWWQILITRANQADKGSTP